MMKQILKWKYLFLLGLIGMLIFITRFLVKRNKEGNKNCDLLRMTLGHLEVELMKLKKEIKVKTRNKQKR